MAWAGGGQGIGDWRWEGHLQVLGNVPEAIPRPGDPGGGYPPGRVIRVGNIPEPKPSPSAQLVQLLGHRPPLSPAL